MKNPFLKIRISLSVGVLAFHHGGQSQPTPLQAAINHAFGDVRSAPLSTH